MMSTLLTILTSFLIVLITCLVICLFFMIRISIMTTQFNKMYERGYSLKTFKSNKYILTHFWIWDARKFATEDTFLERL